MPADLFLRPLFDWRSAVASPYGPAATTRHVLLTLSLHMSPRGDSCFPSIDLLTEESGLSRRAVVEHLGAAEASGWIAKQDRPEKNGQGWRRIEYFPMIPAGVEEQVKQWAAERGARRAPPQRGAPDAQGGAPDDTKVVHHVHLSTSRSTSKRKPSGEAKASPVASLWITYLEGMQALYKASPAPSASAAGKLAQVVKKLGAEVAPRVLAFYLRHPEPFYKLRRHPLELLVRDADKLWIELQQTTGEGADRAPPTKAVVHLEYADGKRRQLDDFPVADHLAVARKVATDYAMMIGKSNPSRIAVQVGSERRTFSIDEVRA